MWSILLLAALDAIMLPSPRAILLTRTFLDSPQLGQPTRIELSLTHHSDLLLDVRLVDDLHPSMVATPITQRVKAFPRDPATVIQTIFPPRAWRLCPGPRLPALSRSLQARRALGSG